MSRSRSSSRGRLDFKKLYWHSLHREFLVDLLKNEGDFLLRRATEGGTALSVTILDEKKNKKIQHFKFHTNQKVYNFESRQFPSLESMVTHYYETGQTISGRTSGRLLNPIYNDFYLIDQNRLTFVQELGKGNFGAVWKAVCAPENETVAVKILSGAASAKDRAECMAEAKLMSLLEHENIVKLKGISFYEPKPKEVPKLVIVLEFCNYGSLDKLLEKGMVEDRGKVRSLLDTAKGLAYLHQREVIHRDIASRNCLVAMRGSKFIVKVADFGLSRLAPDHYELMTKRRLPVYSTAPDALQAREWTSASDVWSFGILMLEVYNQGKNPYEVHFIGLNTELKEVIRKLTSGFRLPHPAGMPKEMCDLVDRCLKKAHERPSMGEVVVFLKNYHASMTLP